MTKEYPIRATKLQTICQELTRLVHQLGPDAKLPTVRELAHTLPASIATVTDALTELEERGQIVRKHGVGIFVAPHLPRRRIAVLCRPAFFSTAGLSPFWHLLTQHVQRRVQMAQEELIFWFVECGTLTAAQQEQLRLHYFQGALGIGLENPAVAWLAAEGIPFVAFAGPGPQTVAIDHQALSTQASAALAARGCRRIAKLPRATAELLPEESGYRWGKTLAAQPRDQWPEGIVSTDDRQTAGLLGAFHEHGIRLIDDLLVATHANVGSPVLRGWEPELIRLMIDPEEIVVQLFTLLEAQLDQNPLPGTEHTVAITTVVGEKVPV